MTFRFNPEDFEEAVLSRDGRIWCTDAATIATKILDQHIATLPEVLGYEQVQGYVWCGGADPLSVSSKRARLWGIEEIAPKKCNHESVAVTEVIPQYHTDRPYGQCIKCNQRMMAKWEEVP